MWQVFDKIGVDYAGPKMVESGPVRWPVIMKFFVVYGEDSAPRRGVRANQSHLHLPVQIHCSMRETNNNLA